MDNLGIGNYATPDDRIEEKDRLRSALQGINMQTSPATGRHLFIDGEGEIGHTRRQHQHPTLAPGDNRCFN
jgi:hypothetical protein